MMEDTIKKLIRLNVELEGVLRVAEARPSAEALAAACDKFGEMSALFDTLGEPKAEDDDKLITDVKEEEAVSAEEAPETVAPPVALDPEPAAPAAPALEAPSAPAPAAPRGDIRKMLTLNDKFLFRRELFNGSDTELNDTLDLVASMDSMHEAEEYLYDDLQLDPENDTVRDFVNIIAAYFNNQAR